MLLVEGTFVARMGNSRTSAGVTHVLMVFDWWWYFNFNYYWLNIFNLLAHIIGGLLDKLVIN